MLFFPPRKTQSVYIKIDPHSTEECEALPFVGTYALRSRCVEDDRDTREELGVSRQLPCQELARVAFTFASRIGGEYLYEGAGAGCNPGGGKHALHVAPVDEQHAIRAHGAVGVDGPQEARAVQQPRVGG